MTCTVWVSDANDLKISAKYKMSRRRPSMNIRHHWDRNICKLITFHLKKTGMTIFINQTATSLHAYTESKTSNIHIIMFLLKYSHLQSSNITQCLVLSNLKWKPHQIISLHTCNISIISGYMKAHHSCASTTTGMTKCFPELFGSNALLCTSSSHTGLQSPCSSTFLSEHLYTSSPHTSHLALHL